MRPSWLCKLRSKVKFPLFCISGTTGPIELKFVMHMECDQTSILHNKVKLIWGYLGYANEGQRSNFPCFVSQEPLVRLNSNFACVWSVTRQAYFIIRLSWYAAILVMQMTVKGQISFHFLSQQPFVLLIPICVCIWSVTRNSYCIIRSSWYAAILVMQMKVKGQISFSFVSQEPLVRLSSNYVCILNVIRRSYHKITPTY